MSRQHGLTRLYTKTKLAADLQVELSSDQARYLRTVLRSKTGDPVYVFNCRDGEWQGRLIEFSKDGAVVMLDRLSRNAQLQRPKPDIWLAFALVKRGTLEAIVQKATELGVSRLIPMATQRSGRQTVNDGRLAAIAVAAAEQSNRLDVPTIEPVRGFADVLTGLSQNVRLFLADETGHGRTMADVAGSQIGLQNDRCICLCIGPEGGFSAEELDLAGRTADVTKIDLGPRILRADTAAIAGLSVIQSTFGDWRLAPVTENGATPDTN